MSLCLLMQQNFLKNFQSNFTTILENPIELKGNYHVALVEISNAYHIINACY
jgi:hypothetical protein